MFKPKRSVIRSAAVSVGVGGMILAGTIVPAQAAGSHSLTVHVSSSNCPWGYGGGVKSVQLGVVPSSSKNTYPVAGSAQTFTVPGSAQLFTIAGNITCGKSGWNVLGKAATNAYLIKYVSLTATQRDVYI